MGKKSICLMICLLAPVTCLCRDITITVVYNNVPHDARLQTSWGMGCVVEGLEKTILFDTGSDGSILLSNMEACTISPGKIDVVVLSHIHGDHVGGVQDFLDNNTAVTVYVPHAFPRQFTTRIEQNGAQVVRVQGPVNICPHAWSTGQLGTGIQEQALVVDTTKGLVVITGCAHPGIVQMVRGARRVAGNSIFLVCGGFHLGGQSSMQVDAIIREFNEMGVETVGPSHCTGSRAIEQFRHAWGRNFTEFGCGATVRIPSR
ncbi:MAG: MBL fold metallo-hydrolase [Desulfomonilia bacterium]